MKRVSFEVAKYLKEVGYPQDYEHVDETYTNLNGGIWAKPTYIEVWLWLWRVKHIAVEADYSCANDDWFDGGICGKKFNDPEKVIEKAIEYLVENDLIK